MYVSPSGHKHVDYWGDVIDGPRVFEWNVFHPPKLATWCVAMEGILCRKSTPEELATGETYREYIAEVEPERIPNHPIGWLVTRRSEKYRALTEEWLNTHGIEYETLVMRNRSNGEDSREGDGFARFKTEVYDSTDADLFLESDRLDAVEIRNRTNKPVFCHGTHEMIRPGKIERAYRDSFRYISKLKHNPVTFSLKATNRLVSRTYHALHRLGKR